MFENEIESLVKCMNIDAENFSVSYNPDIKNEKNSIGVEVVFVEENLPESLEDVQEAIADYPCYCKFDRNCLLLNFIKEKPNVSKLRYFLKNLLMVTDFSGIFALVGDTIYYQQGNYALEYSLN